MPLENVILFCKTNEMTPEKETSWSLNRGFFWRLDVLFKGRNLLWKHLFPSLTIISILNPHSSLFCNQVWYYIYKLSVPNGDILMMEWIPFITDDIVASPSYPSIIVSFPISSHPRLLNTLLTQYMPNVRAVPNLRTVFYSCHPPRSCSFFINTPILAWCPTQCPFPYSSSILSSLFYPKSTFKITRVNGQSLVKNWTGMCDDV